MQMENLPIASTPCELWTKTILSDVKKWLIDSSLKNDLFQNSEETIFLKDVERWNHLNCGGVIYPHQRILDAQNSDPLLMTRQQIANSTFTMQSACVRPT